MATETEYERTYLARCLPDEIRGIDSVVIRDVYIPETVAHAHLRLRQKGDAFVMTKKVPIRDSDSSAMYEHTIELDRAEYDALIATSNRVLQKRRYNVLIDGYEAEVDVYEGGLKGLVTIDFEFASAVDKDSFAADSHALLADVTQEEFIAAGYLSGKSYDDIAGELEKYGYERINEEL